MIFKLFQGLNIDGVNNLIDYYEFGLYSHRINKIIPNKPINAEIDFQLAKLIVQPNQEILFGGNNLRSSLL